MSVLLMHTVVHAAMVLLPHRACLPSRTQQVQTVLVHSAAAPGEATQWIAKERQPSRAVLIVAVANLDEIPDPRHLTQWIKKASGVREIIELHAAHGASFNSIHLSASWMAVSRLSRQRARGSESRGGYTRYRVMPARLQNELKPLLGRTTRNALSGQLGGRELANVLYAVARSRMPPGDARSGLFDALAHVASPQLSALKPQELSNIAWAYATADHSA